MGSCIICGASTEGRICQSHEEDVVFEFRGTRAEQLTPGRFYRGTVDGYADFGVFIDIGDHVTGLLHRSELDRRLESLTWEPGDAVYVQVKNVRDNGNIDLGWSIRQSDTEFRGTLVDDPESNEGTFLPEGESADPSDAESGTAPDTDGRSSSDADTGTDGASGTETESEDDAPAAEPRPGSESGPTPDEEVADASPDAAVVQQEPPAESEGDADAESGDEAAEPETEIDTETRAEIDALEDAVGETVRLEGRIVSIRQTSGPTVFELRDESGTVDCAAFEEAGVRAYPEVEIGDLVRLEGEIRRRRGELQVETEALVALDDEAAETVTGRMDDAMEARARPAELEPLADDPAVEATREEVRDAATAIRRAVIEARPIVVRHDASVDGYLAGAAIERAALPLVEEEHTDAEAGYHYFDRRPLEDGVYDMDDATKDTTSMLSNRDRHDEKLPLVVFAATGSTRDSLDGFGLLSVYGADRVVVDVGEADGAVTDAVDAVVNPSLAGVDADDDTSATALATSVARHVNDGVSDDLRHLPAVSFWEDVPESYAELADEAGYDDGSLDRIREAVALEAYYQSYEDKRELVTDLVFERSEGLVEQISEQFRGKLDSEIETAEANLEERAEGGVAFAVLDTESFTHRFDFPPTGLLLDEVHRRNRDGAFVTLGVDTDELYVRSTFDLDVRAVAERVAEDVDNAGVAARGGRDRIEFVAGERESVVDSVVDAVADLA
ncbi:DNA-binding protein [Halobacteriales archaeon QS_5_70_17]|nr:MAG: DNA-binding protein [Halobacteriales archaeon QS_5_70_17]